MPRAASLAAVIKKNLGIPAAVESGEEGQFDVVADGQIIFSKYKEHRFPEQDEILRMLSNRSTPFHPS